MLDTDIIVKFVFQMDLGSSKVGSAGKCFVCKQDCQQEELVTLVLGAFKKFASPHSVPPAPSQRAE